MQPVAKLVDDVSQFKAHLVTVKAEAQNNINEATAILAKATEDVKQLLETN